ncbi:MAG TPA: HAD-IIB family hydrolase [Pirellulaceae bacterium]|nr:HAD-IIB family hydrolase [Pirellulaceae bacterium]
MTRSDSTRTSSAPQVLATDLDGTFIPADDSPDQHQALEELAEGLARQAFELVYVTGRSFPSVREAIARFSLPEPQVVIADVGTELLLRRTNGSFERSSAYRQYLEELVAPLPRDRLLADLTPRGSLRLQPDEHQTDFKISFFVDPAERAERVAELLERIATRQAPWSLIDSIDPFTGIGLIDLLPRGVAKGTALAWWQSQNGIEPTRIVFAGDSGNDRQALEAGFLAIVVGNADRHLADQVRQTHALAGWNDRLHLAEAHGTAGVLEGCRRFGLLSRANESQRRDSTGPGGSEAILRSIEPHRPVLWRCDAEHPWGRPVYADGSPAPESATPLGATPVGPRSTCFRVWAPRRRDVTVELLAPSGTEPGSVIATVPLVRERGGYFVGRSDDCPVGTDYRLRVDGGPPRPDPASRQQPFSVHGPSRVAAPMRRQRRIDRADVPKRSLVIYELHVGTASDGGTYRDLHDRRNHWTELGVTAIELLPVAQAPGRWNWGYDGVAPFAAAKDYGTPDELAALIDAAHERGFAMLLDVVYNHLGPEGNYLSEFAPYFSRRHRTPWGDGFAFDGPNAAAIERYVVENALRWLDEYRFDGLRLDAIHFMRDERERTIVDAIREAVGAYAAATGRTIHLIGEANLFDAELLGIAGDRAPYDAIWADCLMHSIYSLTVPGLRLTGRDYGGEADLAEALEHGYLYAGPEVRRVTSADRASWHGSTPDRRYLESLIVALQTHDSVGNHPHGRRLHQLASPEVQRAAAALLLLYPSIPMLFMGEEWSADAPFPFFADFEDPGLRRAVDVGRAREYPHHAWDGAPLPSDPQAFFGAKWDRPELRDERTFATYRELLALRRRGIEQQWLAADRLIPASDASEGLFGYAYRRDDGRRVRVIARLDRVADRAARSMVVPTSGELLWSTDGQVERVREGLRLANDQAAVLLEE